MEYTKGEWKVAKPSINEVDRDILIVGGDGYKLAVVCGYNKEQGEAKANAHLIARAPKLDKALRALLKEYIGLAESGDCGFWNARDEQVVKDAEEALAEVKVNEVQNKVQS